MLIFSRVVCVGAEYVDRVSAVRVTPRCVDPVCLGTVVVFHFILLNQLQCPLHAEKTRLVHVWGGGVRVIFDISNIYFHHGEEVVSFD